MRTKKRTYLQHGRRHGPSGSDPIPGGTGPRIAYGQVADDATIIKAGSGDWTAAVHDGYILTITFDPSFSSPPAVVATINENGVGGPATLRQSGVAADHVDIVTSDLSGLENADYGFNFIAVGT